MTSPASAFRRSSSPFSKRIETATKIPRTTIDLPVDAWADNCASKPAEVVKVGLRLLSERAISNCRSVAAQYALRLHNDDADIDNRVDCFNQRLVGLLMAEASVSATDINAPFFGTDEGKYADTKIFLSLTTEGIRFLWDAYEVFALTYCPTAAEASEEELNGLADGLVSGEMIGSLDIERGRKVRRLLKAAWDEATR